MAVRSARPALHVQSPATSAHASTHPHTRPHTHTFIFAGGGTGGHLYPGIAIARELTRQSGGTARSLFVCSDRPLDAEILTKENLEFVTLAARPLSLKPRGMIRFLRSWGKSVRESRVLIRSELERLQAPPPGQTHDRGKNPERKRAGPVNPADNPLPDGRGSLPIQSPVGTVHVVAMGGFVAAPFVQAARVEHVGVTLVNLDAVPGKANRLIARHADRIFTAAAIAPGAVHASKLARWRAVPPIVRPQAVAPVFSNSIGGTGGEGVGGASKAECRAALGLDPNATTLLVTGGSQGARSINQLLIALLDQSGGTPESTVPSSPASTQTYSPKTSPDRQGAGHPLVDARGSSREKTISQSPVPAPSLCETTTSARWQVLHQCGKDDVEILQRAYQQAGITALVEPFVTSMGLWWGAADLAISRAGAGSVAEAWANHVPAIFLPYPYHRDLHQKHNARVLVEAGGALLAYDTLDAKRTLADMAPALQELLDSPTKRQAMQAALTQLGPACGAERIAEALLGEAGC